MEVPFALQISNDAIDSELEEVELVDIVYAPPSSRLSLLGVTKNDPRQLAKYTIIAMVVATLKTAHVFVGLIKEATGTPFNILDLHQLALRKMLRVSLCGHPVPLELHNLMKKVAIASVNFGFVSLCSFHCHCLNALKVIFVCRNEQGICTV
ncbi:unnamed protein product [Sphenostylis stenocarpa]|uniref:Uncharacterized protein n=1 Tax=Sphenostylis stenocarpa TaxID=92480 RepID=A0AA86W5G1_9FABA|nr:unnamed protein product [Sphenostylis stenocarpa]